MGAARPAAAQATEVMPEHAFEASSPVGTAPVTSSSDSAATAASASEGEANVPKVSSRDKGEGFNLWDFFAGFFELRPPGDPNHPDKLKLTVGTSIGYDSNVFTTYNDPIASGTAGINGTASYNFGSERLKIGSDLALGTTYYDNRPGDNNDFNGTFSGRVVYQANRRLQFSTSLGAFYASQPDPTLLGGTTRFSGDYYGANFDVALSYALRPRLSARLGYRFNTIKYVEEAQNQQLAFTDQTYFVGFDYLISPRVTLTTEYRYNPLSYDEADQDSTGHIFTVGFIASINPRLKWTLQGGAEGRVFATSDNTQGDGGSTYLGPFLETNLEYNFAPGSSLVGSIRYGTEPSGFAGISIRETLRGALTFIYSFTPRLTGSLGVTYQHDNYDQPGEINDFTQEFYTGGLGLSFQVNPALSLFARYDYSMLQAESASNGYNRSITTLGLQIIF